MSRRGVAVLAACACLSASWGAAAIDVSGQVRPQYVAQQLTRRGPLAQADALQSGLVASPADGPVLDTELRAHGGLWSAVGTLEQQDPSDSAWKSRAWFNELYVSGDASGWQLSAGRRIVAWDVGYGFRPNDIVQQEARRTLLSVTPVGRSLLMAERYDARSAWSLVAVNLERSRQDLGAQEPAVDARVYWRDGAVDWHGFARVGVRTGVSLGTASSWVASDAIELHGSVRWLHAADSLAIDPQAAGLVRTDPWAAATVHNASQALIGATWTNAQQVSVLGEAWWDGTALSAAQWDGWNIRNRALAGWIGTAAPVAAVAGNFAWQGDALTANGNLQRANLYLRLSWSPEHWQPAVDLLYQPADGGRVLTASLGWQGDRVRLDAVWRWYGGPSSSVLAQLPTRQIACVAATWTF